MKCYGGSRSARGKIELVFSFFLVLLMVQRVTAQVNPGVCVSGSGGCLFALGGICQVEHAVCILNINLSIPFGGTLILSNTTLMMNGTFNGSIGINVTGIMDIGNKTNITNGNNNYANGTDTRYFFWVRPRAFFRMTDSILEEVGWEDTTDKRGLQIEEIMVAFRNNTIRESFYGMVLLSSLNNVENSTFVTIGKRGIFLNNSHNNILKELILENIEEEGVALHTSHNNRIENSFIKITLTGIATKNSNKTVIDNTTITNFSTHGMKFAFSNNDLNITNNTISNADGITTAIFIQSGLRNRIISNAIYNLSSAADNADVVHVSSREAHIADNHIFNNSVRRDMVDIVADTNVTNNSFRENRGETVITLSGAAQRLFEQRIDGNSFIENNGSKAILFSLNENNTFVRNNTFINNSGKGIYYLTSSNGNITNNTFQEHGATAIDYPVYIANSINTSIYKNTMFRTAADIDLFIVAGASMNVSLNHFLSKGVDGGILTDSNFCVIGEGNFYNESIPPENIGPNDCGLVNLTDFVEESCPPRYFRLFWRRQSAFLPVTYYLYATNSETLEEIFLGTSDSLNSNWIDDNILSDGNYTFKIVPFITQFSRHNGTVNRTSTLVEICPGCKGPHVFKEKPEPGLSWPSGIPIWINATVTDNLGVDNISANVTDPNNILATMKLLPPIKPQKDHLLEYDYLNSTIYFQRSGGEDPPHEALINQWLNRSRVVLRNNIVNDGVNITANFTLNTSCVQKINFSFAFATFSDEGTVSNWQNITTNISLFNYSAGQSQQVAANFTQFQEGDSTEFLCAVVKLGVFMHPDFKNNGVSNFSLIINITDQVPEAGRNNGTTFANCEGEIFEPPSKITSVFIWSRIQPGHTYHGLYNDTGISGLYNVSYFANDTSNNINDTERTNFTVT